jgi:hypothetical protein
MKTLKLKKVTNYFGCMFLGIGIRLLGVSTLMIGISLMIIPFVLIFLLFGVNKANLLMSYVMRKPINWTFGKGTGDSLLEIHRDIDKGII